jgi:hypothetical protein
MKFYINKIILWLKNGTTRELKFENNKVNVITGNSKTGKTAILEIIDYCLCGSESNISVKHIGENVLWYGLNFNVNDKIFTIARGERKNNSSSKDYYFSGSGVIPDLPVATMPESSLKTIIEQEFGISHKVTFSYGGKSIQSDSKISYRYFLMFNTQSGNVITHSDTYFDKQNIERYRNALPRIFDIATGITTIENIAIKDKIELLNKEIIKYTRQKENHLKSEEDKKVQMMTLIKRAKEARIINLISESYEDDLEKLKHVVNDGRLGLVDFDESTLLDDMKRNRQTIIINLRKLKRFSRRYLAYKNYLSKEQDSLKPIKYMKKFVENIENDEYKQFMNILEQEYMKIRKDIRNKMPFEFDVEDKIVELENQLKEVEEKIQLYPVIDEKTINDKERYIAIGEIKTEFLKLLNVPEEVSYLEELIALKQKELKEWEDKYDSSEEKRVNMIEALNDYIQTYINLSKEAFEEYGQYLSAFNYNKKTLELRQSKATFTEKLSSSSDHLFMHLCLFLGMSEMILENKVPYVPSLLILDQPSRPYFNNKKYDLTKSKEFVTKKDDWNKVTQIFKLLNSFFENINKNKYDYQMIVLEHVSIDAWEGCEYVHLVKIFDGIEEALIPPSIANMRMDSSVSIDK